MIAAGGLRDRLAKRPRSVAPASNSASGCRARSAKSSPSERGDWKVPNEAEPVRSGAAAAGSIGSPAIRVIASTIGR